MNKIQFSFIKSLYLSYGNGFFLKGRDYYALCILLKMNK